MSDQINPSPEVLREALRQIAEIEPFTMARAIDDVGMKLDVDAAGALVAVVALLAAQSGMWPTQIVESISNHGWPDVLVSNYNKRKGER